MRIILLLLITIFASSLAKAQLASTQIIHNCADPAASEISIWIVNSFETTKIVDNLKFRESTGFKPVPAATPTKIAIAPANSQTIRDTIAGLTTEVNLSFTNSYIIMMAGNIDTGYKANPDGEDTKFKLLIIEDARVRANDNTKVEVMVVHGSTDAPTIDMIEESRGTVLANDIKYGEASAYTAFRSDEYRFIMKNKNSDSTLGAFLAPFSTMQFFGEAPVVFASGYLNPAENKNGAQFGWFAAVADQVISLNDVTSINDITKQIAAKLYPNPTTTNLNIEFTLANNSPITLEMYDNLGRVVYTKNTKGIAGSNSLKINTSTFSAGVYFCTLKTKEGINTTRVAVSK